MRLSHLMQMDEFEKESTKDANWWPSVLLRVMEGDSLAEIAGKLLCNGAALRQWIKLEDWREDEYLETLERRREMLGEELLGRTARAAMATVQDAQSGSGEWLEVGMWPKGLLAAADSVEFGSDGRPFKIKMDAGKHADRLGRLLGLDKPVAVNVGITSLVNVLSGMPAGAPRMRPGQVEDAEVIPAKRITNAVAKGNNEASDLAEQPGNFTHLATASTESVAQTGGGSEADAGEVLREREPQGKPPPENPPRRSVMAEPSYDPI